ncbi:MAG: folate-binding protein [Pseudomonadota bacterium]
MAHQFRLENRAVVGLAGKDCTPFLQNIITCDVENLASSEARHGALLTPQGKILFEFILQRREEGYWIDVHADLADDFIKRLTFYKLRADVSIERTDKSVFVDLGRTQPNQDGWFADPRLADLGMRRYGDDPSLVDGTKAWNTHRIQVGVAELVEDYDPSSVFPHEAMFDHFAHGGVDFEKGCYVGQEVVSRMQHRGTARSRFIHVHAPSGQPLPEKGTDVSTADGKTIGTMGSSTGSGGLALVRLDRAAAAQTNDFAVRAGDTQVELQLPAYFPGAWPQ